MTFDEFYYREYANSFWDELNSTFWKKKDVLGYLPIVFTELPTVKGMQYIQGVTSIHINEKKHVYSCFPVVFIRPDNTESQLHRTIRHEIIHYFLALNYYNHEDNSALFNLLCGLMDGGAYENLSNKAQIIYDSSKPYLEQAYELYVHCKENTEKSDSMAMKLSMMIDEIDRAEHDQTSDFNSLVSTLSLLLKICKSNVL